MMNDIYTNNIDEDTLDIQISVGVGNIVNDKFNNIDNLSSRYSDNFTYLDLKWIFDLTDNDQLRFISQYGAYNELGKN